MTHIKRPFFCYQSKTLSMNTISANINILVSQFAPDESMFLELLIKRNQEFINAFKSELDNQKSIQQQYQKFALTLERCLGNPERLDSEIKRYQEIDYYYPVGSLDESKSLFEHKMILALISTSSILILVGVSLSLFCLPAGIAAISFGLVGNIIGAIMLSAAMAPQANQLKEEERLLLTLASNLISKEELKEENATNDKKYSTTSISLFEKH